MKKITATIGALVLATLALTACGPSAEFTERKENQSTVLDNSLGKANQEERLSREEDPNQIRYVYLLAKLDGGVLGYYTINGKVSPAGTQNAPEQEIICKYNSGESCIAVDSAKDDGTYGASDSGSFFFTTEGVLIETTLDYLQSDAPIAFYGDAPKLNQ